MRRRRRSEEATGEERLILSHIRLSLITLMKSDMIWIDKRHIAYFSLFPIIYRLLLLLLLCFAYFTICKPFESIYPKKGSSFVFVNALSF